MPVHYIGLIESMGLSDKLNLYVASECLKKTKDLEYLNKDLVMSINISPHTYNLEKNIKTVIDILSKENTNPKIKFNLEITETNFMTSDIDLSKDSKISKMLSEHNIELALDDFGVQYSSITRLLESNFSTIKIDMSFVQKLDYPGRRGASAKTTVEAIMHLAKGLGIKVIAEGIETETQAAILTACGCELGQGYYFFKPLSFETLVKSLSL